MVVKQIITNLAAYNNIYLVSHILCGSQVQAQRKEVLIWASQAAVRALAGAGV